ncbi:MAG: SRPBCC family protein [Paracoccaceae bacterium]|jgi:carbon monoxide dehydrogenase subunit G|uniref:SRPBCC family protein n=1 Tax=unclassified Seohaeicola TaxID=2641111 RepID=UPI00237B98A4|nr:MULTISPECIES: SRPBCC family protein [unclassified Seohaeicola]MDD9705844.1 SRPBCC family protein [Seohaeicola sp. 4SK31]MDD9735355.1 SRPBCC family protein [Seohaeicola sp. SP36]MDM7969797.1 SRPBCC family protein [Paracoccaceae bacterium]
MKFSAKEDIEAPIEQVFALVSDFAALERAALRRGAEVQRTDSLHKPGVGMSWTAAFMARGRQRKLDIVMTTYEPPHAMRFDSVAQGLHSNMTVELVALSRGRTRLSVDLELKPKSISARLFVQSLKLARNTLNKKFHLRMADYASDLEDRARRAT